MFGFEKLDVWKKSGEFADEVYKATAKFPRDERFGLTNQIRRAAVSISSNISEGSGRNSNAEFVRFIAISYGSLLECVSQLHIARRQEFISEVGFNQLNQLAEEVSRMLCGLRSSMNISD